MRSASMSHKARPERVGAAAHTAFLSGRRLLTSAAVAVALLAGLVGASDAPRSAPATLAATVTSWPDEYMVTGTKTEPTYIEYVRFGRRGDLFGLEIDIVAQGNHPGGRTRTVLSVSPRGVVTRLGCGRPTCAVEQPPHGFLATAWVLALHRRSDLRAPIRHRDFAGRTLLCLDDVALGTTRPVMDPCLDSATGAAPAQLSRLNPTRFAGPTLDETGIDITLRAADDLFVPSPDDRPG
jgi:hypothetical protein